MAYSVTIDVEHRQISINGSNYTFAGLKAKKNKTTIENELSKTCDKLGETSPVLFTDEELDKLYAGNDNSEMYNRKEVFKV